MNAPALIPRFAWLPLTPRGVAAFASARLSRLLLVQFFVALIAAAAFGWFLHTAWFPTIREAIGQLPDGARISGGTLEWPGESPALLAEGRFLALAVDLKHTRRITSTAHVQLEFGERDWEASSLLGILDAPGLVDTTYPRGQTIAADRSTVGPWWGAREPFLIALAMAGVVGFLFVSWAALATVYFLPAWLVGFFANRTLSWAGSWRLAGAALMPGALLLSAAIVLYGLQAFDLVKLGLAFGMHLIVGWLYILASPLFLPRHPEVPPAGRNPFTPGT